MILLIEVLEECDAKFETLLDAGGKEKDEDDGESFIPTVGDTDRNGCGKEIDGVIRLPPILLLLLLLALLVLMLLQIVLMLLEQVLEFTMLAFGPALLDDLEFVCSCRLSVFQSGFMNEKSRNSS